MPFSRTLSSTASLRPPSRAPRFAKPGWTASHLPRSGGSLITLPDSPILLDHNENAYGPSERVRAVLASSSETKGNRYPRNQYDALRNQLVNPGRR